jgi:hypothetical protein
VVGFCDLASVFSKSVKLGFSLAAFKKRLCTEQFVS